MREQCPAAERDDWDRLLAAAREAAAVAEDDDALYARAQAHVRRALLAEGHRLAAAGVLERAGDVFWLPLDVVRRFARGDATLTRDEAARLIAAARDERRPRAHDTAAQLDAATAGTDGGLGSRAAAARPARASASSATGPSRRHATRTPSRPSSSRARSCPRSCRSSRPPRWSSRRAASWTTSPRRPASAASPPSSAPPARWRALSDGDRVLVDGDAGLVARLG